MQKVNRRIKGEREMKEGTETPITAQKRKQKNGVTNFCYYLNERRTAKKKMKMKMKKCTPSV